jgi:zinc D-Ala-D-Ala carboxypeptidase
MKYFKLREFVCSCGCGKNKINRTFVKVLDAARAYSKDENGSDIPFIITSGYRCEQHYESKKNPNSSHIKGLAADILVKNSRERAVILAALMNAGFTRFGISSKKNGPNFIHVDLDEDKIQGVIWTY